MEAAEEAAATKEEEEEGGGGGRRLCASDDEGLGEETHQECVARTPPESLFASMQYWISV